MPACEMKPADKKKYVSDVGQRPEAELPPFPLGQGRDA